MSKAKAQRHLRAHCVGHFGPGSLTRHRPKAGKDTAMSNVVPFQPKDPTVATLEPEDGVFGISSEFEFEPEDFINSRLPFSCDIIQHEAKGMVFLEACVPAAMAITFLQMLTASQAAALAT
jgi:hypothetical protein